MSKKVSFKVGMTCGGCKGAVTRILSKIEGNFVTDVNVCSQCHNIIHITQR